MIDIHHFSKNLDTLKNQIRKSTRISERNKILLLKFSADCQTGWGDKKLSLSRILKLLSNMKRLSEMIKKDWDLITKDDIRDIGGIGSRQIKHVTFDELGAKVTMYDKTMRGEPVRFVSSSSYLHIS